MPEGLKGGAAWSSAPSFGAARTLRRAVDRHLFWITLAVSVALFVPGRLIGASWSDGPPNVVGSLGALVLTFVAGYRIDAVLTSLCAMVVLAFGSTTGDMSGSVVSMWVFTVPAWVIGRIMWSRSRLSAQLAARARELEAEREAYARESVRYERARIARDLHDMVAHNLSMIVVQAAAGRRSLASAPEVASASLRHIQDGARRAEREIEQLVGLLGTDRAAQLDGHGLRLVDELVRRAATVGLSVTYAVSGSGDELEAELSEAGYRVVQEGITNALKHAPGAAVRVAVDASPTRLRVAVVNGPPAGAGRSWGELGAGFGISGLRDRVTALGGTLEAGPTEVGGWQLAAEFPPG